MNSQNELYLHIENFPHGTIDEDLEVDEVDDDPINTEAIYSVQKMADVLKEGSPDEKEFVLYELQQLLDHCFEDTIEQLVPVLCQYVAQWSVELQFKTAEALLMIVTKTIPSDTAIMVAHCAQTLLQEACHSLSDDDRDVFYDVWGDVLLEVIPDIEFTEDFKKEMIDLTIDLAQGLEATRRRLAARLAGALAQSLMEVVAGGVLLPVVIQLSNDEDIVVKGTAGEALAAFGSHLPETVMNEMIWPRILEYLKEPDYRIPGTALRTISTIAREQRLKEGPKTFFTELLPPVVNEWCSFAAQQASKDQRTVDDDMYNLLSAISDEIGELIYSTWVYKPSVNLRTCLKGYFKMSICNGPLIRRNCSFNIPGITEALCKSYSKEMCDLVEFFSRDGDDEVRWNTAAGLHETIRILAPKANGSGRAKLLTAFEHLIQDNNPLVRMKVLENLASILKHFSQGQVTSFAELAPVFVNLQTLSEGAWRIQQQFSQQLAESVDLIAPDLVKDNILPILFTLADNGTPLVRKTAVIAIIRGIRAITELKKRNFAIKNIWKRLLDGTYWSRLTFIDGGLEAINVFSSWRFEKLFFPNLLYTAEDNVTNVRLKLVRALPRIAAYCSSLHEINRILESFKIDEDADIAKAAMEFDEKYKEELKIAEKNKETDAEKKRIEDSIYGEELESEKKIRLTSLKPVDVKDLDTGIEELSLKPGKSEKKLTVTEKSSVKEGSVKKKKKREDKEASSNETKNDSGDSKSKSKVKSKSSLRRSSSQTHERNTKEAKSVKKLSKISVAGEEDETDEARSMQRALTWSGEPLEKVIEIVEDGKPVKSIKKRVAKIEKSV